MRDNFADISVVLDRSGSMSTIKHDIEGGFNTYVEELKKQPGEAVLSLYQFDNVYESVYTNKELKDVPKLTLLPRNGTALYDAIAKTIIETGERLSKMNEADRPDRVIVVVLTDGGENASQEYDRRTGGATRVADLIKHQEQNYSWTFVFLGANQDAVLAGGAFGMSAGKSITYGANAAGVQNAFNSLVDNTRSLRSMTKEGYDAKVATGEMFTAEDRVAALGGN